jgi:formate dehydrogenase maturation protein FdhE
MDWDIVIARADTLASRHRAAADLLFFYRAVVRYQREIYHRVRHHPPADGQKLDTQMLASYFPDFLQLVEKHGPPELVAQARKFEDRQDWEQILHGCWQQTHERLEIIARAILQPYVQYLSERWYAEVGMVSEGTGSCPFCSRAPLVGVTNGRRLLVCSLCSHEWTFPEKICPGCHSNKIKIHHHRSTRNVCAETCESCGHYLKSVDLRMDPAAVAVVDELASVELDDLMREKGYLKLELNVAGQ